MPYCRCDEVTLYFEIHGAGPPLVLIAGLGGGSWSWYGQVPYFKKRYRTIIFDNRGAGRSSIPPGPYRIRQLADDAKCLLDYLGVERFFLLGLSMGGMIVQELALAVPQRVQAMLLGCTHAGGASTVLPTKAVMAILLHNAGLTPQQIIEKNLPLFLSETCLEQQPEVVAAYCAAQLSAPPQPAAGFNAQMEAIKAFDAGVRLREIRIPTMIVTGDQDLLIPPENAALLARAILHAEMVVMAGCGHALHAECGDRLNRVADAFFQRHLSSGLPAETS